MFGWAMILAAGVLCVFCASGASGQSVEARMSSIADFHRRATEGRELSVVFLGGSLTWGANASDPQRTSYRALMSDYLRKRYPRSSITFHDAAIGGTGSMLGLFRLERDVLSRKPDLVFLDFTANDDLYSDDATTLDSYESIVRILVSQGVAVEQVSLGFKFNFGSQYAMNKLKRVAAHQKIAAAYRTAVGDCFPLVQGKLDKGECKISELWPFDGAHPDDAGYRLFFEAAVQGYEQALADERVAIVPESPVFSTKLMTRSRNVLALGQLPAGWQPSKTYRTSMWFDGLSSRWISDVAMFDATTFDATSGKPVALRVEFSGTVVGLLGEADDNALPFKVRIDGEPVLHRASPAAAPTEIWSWDTKKMGSGRLLTWKVIASSLPAGKHVIEIEPVIDSPAEAAKNTATNPATKPAAAVRVVLRQLRIESVCAAGGE